MDITYDTTIVQRDGKYINDFKTLVSLNQVSGVSRIRKFGSNPDTSTTNREVINFYTNDTNTYNGWFDVNTQLYLISDNAADTTESITIYGIKESGGLWVDTIEEFQLNGITSVDIGSWLRVNRLRTKMPVTNNILGNIYVTQVGGNAIPIDSDNIIAAIMLRSNGESLNSTKMAIYTISSNKIALIDKIFVSSLNAKTGVFDIDIRPKGGDWINVTDFTQQTSGQFDLGLELIPSETDIKILSSYSTAGGETATSASFQMYIVDSNKLYS